MKPASASLSVFVDQLAAAHGRSGRWSCDDIEAARILGNHSADSPCDPPRSPAEVWAARRPITRGERKRLGNLYRAEEAGKRVRRNFVASEQRDVDERASIDRAAVCRALVATDYLEI